MYAKKEKKYILILFQKITREKQLIISMIPSEGACHYLTIKKVSTLLRGITSKHHRGLYYLNCLHSFAAESKRESHKKLCDEKGFCNIIVPSEDTKMLKLNQNQISNYLTTIYSPCRS